MEMNSWELRGSAPVHHLKQLLRKYGLGLLFTANIFGAGSVYILSNTGGKFGYSLLWTMPLTLLLGLGMHEMSAQLATINQPLMEYIRDAIGKSQGKLLALFIAFIMHFWGISNYAIGGAALVWLTPLNNVYIGILLVAGVGVALVELKIYHRVEAAIAAIILTVFGIYLVIAGGINLPLHQLSAGFVPTINTDVEYLTMAIALFGTTIYYPNFFIQSSIQQSKSWSEMRPYRRDHTVGLCFVILLSIAVMIVAAAILEPQTPSLTSPAEPLLDAIGKWAVTTFVVAVFLASFTSATGTLFAAGFMIPQSWGKEIRFGDRMFRRVVEVLIGLSVVFAILLMEYTGANPVRLGIIMPAVNGVVGLPITAVALYFANRRFFDHPPWLRIALGLVVIVMIVLSLVTGRELATTVMEWL